MYTLRNDTESPLLALCPRRATSTREHEGTHISLRAVDVGLGSSFDPPEALSL